MNAVTSAIFENMRQIEIVFEDTCEGFKKDRKNTGDSREITVKQFLESFFPSSFIIKKGPIYNLNSESQEIDCVILAPNHPKLLTPKREVIIAEGVFTAVEVKPDISSLPMKSITAEKTRCEFRRALWQIQSVKKLKRNLPAILRTLEELTRIPCVIFAKKSRSAKDTINYMIQCLKNNAIEPFELPDIILTLDNGLIYHTLDFEKSAFNEISKDHKGEVFVHIDSKNEVTLGTFILLLLSFSSPEPLMQDHIIKEYIKQGFEEVIVFNFYKP